MKHVKYECPECGSRVISQTLTSMPPTTVYDCLSCDYRHEEQHEIETVTAPE